MSHEKRVLRAGPVSAIFDNGDLRYIRTEGREVLRRVYFALRDPEWTTLTNQISNLRIVEGDGGFTIDYDADCRLGEIHFRWTARIAGVAAGSIVWTAKGEALTTFLKNRIGWCILHPVDGLAGTPCEVEHTGGGVERGFFPREIAPHQPFIDMRAIRHEVLPGLTAELRFTGDSFEIEDQRNWTDSTYKIYSTPLALPIPAAMRAGDRLEPTVELRLTRHLRVELTGDPVPMPEIGYRYAESLTAALRPAHIRVDRPEQLAPASALGVPLEGPIPGVQRFLVLDTDVLPPPTAGVEVAVGTGRNFAEFNRGRPDTTHADAVCFPMNPEIHAMDDATLVENLAPQAAVVEHARRLAPRKRIAVTPVFLDPQRHGTWFAAAWTLGSLKYLAESRASTVTYDAPTGPVHDLLVDLAGATQAIPCRSTEPLTVEALVVDQGERRRVFLANFTGREQQVELPGRTVTLPRQSVSSFDL